MNQKEKAYTVAGNKGILFEFTDGKKVNKLMIGSQTLEKLAEDVRAGIKLNFYIYL